MLVPNHEPIMATTLSTSRRIDFLLDDMRQLMGQQVLAFLRRRGIFSGSKIDIAAGGVRVGSKCVGRMGGARIRVNPYGREIRSQSRFHGFARTTIQ